MAKRRFKAALEQFEHKHLVEIKLRAYRHAPGQVSEPFKEIHDEQTKDNVPKRPGYKPVRSA
ncbi:hypothetical protein LOY28_14980 [Pseudomonas sp. B21-017]|nr:hypothetical protein LOY28_14980 [Pseudomonas sp. B21-017]